MLKRVGAGIYAKSHKNKKGAIVFDASPDAMVQELLRKWGENATLVETDLSTDRYIFLIDVGHSHQSRKIQLSPHVIEHNKTLAPPKQGSIKVPRKMPEDLDLLPRTNVDQYVKDFSKIHHVTGHSSIQEDWADAVTRAAGDDVSLDVFGRLLANLYKKKLINSHQMARLMTNYLVEQKTTKKNSTRNRKSSFHDSTSTH